MTTRRRRLTKSIFWPFNFFFPSWNMESFTKELAASNRKAKENKTAKSGFVCTLHTIRSRLQIPCIDLDAPMDIRVKTYTLRSWIRQRNCSCSRARMGSALYPSIGPTLNPSIGSFLQQMLLCGAGLHSYRGGRGGGHLS